MYSLGVDCGTSSVRALVVRCSDGAELGSAVFGYPSGTAGVLLNPQDHQLARQHPGDHFVNLETSVCAALAAAAAGGEGGGGSRGARMRGRDGAALAPARARPHSDLAGAARQAFPAQARPVRLLRTARMLSGPGRPEDS